MPMTKLPGTVSKPAETMVRQMDLISAERRLKCISFYQIVRLGGNIYLG